MRYRWRLIINGTAYLVHPVYKDDLSLDYERENNQRFFRRKLSSKINFVGVDAELIINAAFYTEFNVIIQKQTDTNLTWYDYYYCKFYKTDCIINEDDKLVSVQPQVVDNYNDVLDGYEKEYNLIELAPAIQSVQAVKRPMYQIFTEGEDIVTCLCGGNSFEQDLSDSSASEATRCHFATFADRWEFNFETAQAGFSTPFIGIFSGYRRYTQVGDRFYNTDNYYYIELFEIFEPGDIFEHIPFTYENGLRIKRISDDVIVWLYTSGQHSGEFVDIPTEITFVHQIDGYADITATRSNISIFGRIVLDKDTLTVGGTDYTTYELSNDIVSNNRNYRYCAPYTLYIRQSTRTSATPTQWGKNDLGQYFLPPDDVSQWYPVGRTQWVNTSVWLLYDTTMQTWEIAGQKEYTIRDTYPLSSVISVLLAKIAPDITHLGTAEYSNFLYGTAFYELQDTMTLLVPKSNVLAGEYQTPAMKAPITLASVMTMLRNVFGCYWFIDDEQRFRIEHISWFKNGGSYGGTPTIGTDLTTLLNKRNDKTWAFSTSEYQYDKSDMPARYQYSWMDEVTQLFKGNAINVLSNFVQEDKVEEITIAQYTSDIDFMLLAGELCSMDGFALLQALENEGTYSLPIHDFTYNGYTYRLQNYMLSMFYLQTHFLTYDMPSWNIEVNDTATTAAGIQRNKKQQITFPVGDSDIDTSHLVKTDIGNGEFDKVSLNLSSRAAKTTLKYNTYEQ